MSPAHWIELPKFGDHRGSLVAIEAERTIPFPIRRVYYLYATLDGVERGFHAHRELRQVAVCVSGHCTMHLDDGRRKQDHVLDDPTQGLFINRMIWREMRNFSADCVLLVLAEHHYDEADYIREYDAFLLEALKS